MHCIQTQFIIFRLMILLNADEKILFSTVLFKISQIEFNFQKQVLLLFIWRLKSCILEKKIINFFHTFLSFGEWKWLFDYILHLSDAIQIQIIIFRFSWKLVAKFYYFITTVSWSFMHFYMYIFCKQKTFYWLRANGYLY